MQSFGKFHPIQGTQDVGKDTHTRWANNFFYLSG